MEIRNTKTASYASRFNSLESYDDGDELTRQRLETLLAINAETARAKSLYASDREKVEAGLMKNPLSSEQTFKYFGLLLGAFPPAALFARFLTEGRGLREEQLWIFGILAVSVLVSAIVGYFSGKLIGRIVGKTEKSSWTKMILLLPFVGILWGVLAGGAGGAVFLIIGALPGAFVGALVGSVALTIFTIFHRLLKKGESIDRKHFLPTAFGVTFSVCAFFLGV